MASNSRTTVDSGDLLTNILIPHHVVEYTYQKDKGLFLQRWIREIFRFMKINCSSAGKRRPSHVFLPSGSRTSSLRTPFITVFDAEGNKTMILNDMDLMVTHPDVIVGNSSGPLHMEFVPDQDVGYGKIVAISGAETRQELFLPVTNENGIVVNCLSGNETLKFTYKDNPDFKNWPSWQKTGPARERLNDSITYGEEKFTTKADIVPAILSANNYFMDDVEKVMTRSSWSSEIKEAVSSTPISFVPVAPKTREDDGITWRASFSMQELVIARSLPFDQRHIYMVIKFASKYLLVNNTLPDDNADKYCSSYMLMNAFFAFYDWNRERDWSVKKMETVCDFFKYVTKCLTQKYLPQYFCPRNNLIKDVTAEWLNFYTELFTFPDELAIVKFLLNAQRTWRMPHFERPIQAHWSGENLTLNEVKSVLINLSLDAIFNMKLVRVVQNLWNHSEIWQSLIFPERDNGMDKKATLGQMIEFWEDVLAEIESLAKQRRISKTKYICLLRLIQVMAPLGDDLMHILQGKLDGQKCDDVKEEVELETYSTVNFKGHGEIADSLMTLNNSGISIQLTETNESFIFPYTDHLLLNSDPFLYFLICYKHLRRFSPNEVQSTIEAFLDGKGLPEELQSNPVVKLACVLKSAFSKERLVFHEWSKYKVCPPVVTT